MVVKADITIDIDKQVGNLQNLTNIYNARVGDSNTPLTVLWQKNGIALNLKGLHAFIAGKVGDGSYNSETDKVDFPVGTPVVKYEDDGSGTLDDGQSGLTTLLIPEQMWSKTGLFAGYIGLKDENGSVFTSKDIFFKVLGNVLDTGVAINYFIDDFDKALAKATGDTQNAIDDIRNTYEAEAKNSHDSLDALNSQIQANRDEQENLSQRLAGTEQQIQTNDVITKPEFYQLSNQLTQQVSQMRQSGLEFFNNVGALKEAYPQGANKLCVTLDDSHQWIYDYAHGQWVDAGAFNYGTIDPKLTSTIYQNNSDNLILNSDFHSMDFWNPGRDGGVVPNAYVDETNRINDSNAFKINGFVQAGTSNESWVQTSDIPLAGHNTISVGADLAISGINTGVGDSAGMDITWLDKDKKVLDYYRCQATPSNDGNFRNGFRKYMWENIQVASMASYFKIAFNIYGEGTMEILRPHANYGRNLLDYAGHNVSTNLRNWQPSTDGASTITFDDSKLTTLIGDGGLQNYVYLSSPIFWIKDKYSFNLVFNGKAQWTQGSGENYVEIREYNQTDSDKIVDSFSPSKVQQFKIWPSDEFFTYKFNNIRLDRNTVAFVIRIVGNGNSQLEIKDFDLNYCSSKESILTYDSSNFQQMCAIKDGLYNLNCIEAEAGAYNFLSSQLIPKESDNIDLSIIAKSVLTQEATLQPRIYLEINQYTDMTTANNNLNIWRRLKPTSSLVKYDFKNIQLDQSTQFFTVGIILFDKCNISFSNLRIKASDVEHNDSQITVPAYDFWTNPADQLNYDYDNDTVELKAKEDKGQWAMASSNYYRVKPGSVISFETLASSNIDNQATARIEINQYSDLSKPFDSKLNRDLALTKNDNLTKYKLENIKLDDSTKFIQFRLAFAGTGYIRSSNITVWGMDHIPTESSQLPQMNILSDAQITDKWTKAAFSFDDKDRNINGYLQFAIQGDSSKYYPKKNLKIKTFKDEDCKDKLEWYPKADWDKNNKFNIKANYIDATQARNLVDASIFAKATAITPFTFKAHENLAKSQNLGQMEGIPIELYFNYQYYGLMTLNIKKNAKSYGLNSDDPKQEAIANDTVYTNAFGDSTQNIDGKAFETIVRDTASDTLKTNFANFEKFVGTSTDDDFKHHIADYIDVNSAINAYLFGNLSRMDDFANKSIILLTWDEGKTYYLTLYDLDSTWGLYWNGSQLNSHPEAWSLDYKKPGNSITMIDGSEAYSNQLYRRLYKLFKPEIKAQYQKLRSTVWDNAQIINAFKHFIRSIPEEAFEREQTKWPDIPSKSITSFEQIQQSVIERGNAMDSLMDNLAPTVDPLENLQNQINQLKNGAKK